MEITERQQQRRRLAIEKYANNRHRWPSPREIGIVWNGWKEQALWVGNSLQRAQELADEVMFGIPESEMTDEESDKQFQDWISYMQNDLDKRKAKRARTQVIAPNN